MSFDSWFTATLTLLGVAYVVVMVLVRVAALGIIPGNRRPSSGMAWLLLVLLSPLLGLLAFGLFGSTRLGTRRHARQRHIRALIADRAQAVPDAATVDDAPDAVRSVVHLNHTLASFPLLKGNAMELIPGYHDSIGAMAAAVRAAEDHVHVEFYITAWDDVTDPLLSAMADAHDRGVAVRLLLDHLGSRGIPGYADLTKRLDATGIAWHLMLPIRPLQRRFRRPDLRNHRKLLVVDGTVGFMGSQNLTEPGYNKPKNHAAGRRWVELMTRVSGPIVLALEAVFAQDWYAESEELLTVAAPAVGAAPTVSDAAVSGVACQLVPSGPGYPSENNLRLFTSLVYGATRRLSITSPYFVPDESLLYAVTTAAQRGVEVELFVSEQSDQFMVGHAQASYYQALLDAGVRIYLYPAPAVLHAKHLSIDDSVAVLGSSNLDMRSFALNYEVTMMALGPQIVARMRAVENGYRAISRELTAADWSRRPAAQRYLDNVMRLTAALQ